MTSTETAPAMNVRIEMLDATSNQSDFYGITHESATLHRVVGVTRRLHNNGSPHQVVAWDNTRRHLKGGYRSGRGEGRYVDPFGDFTDEETTICLSAQATVIDNYGTGTQCDAPFSDVETVTLVWPDGTEQAFTVDSSRAFQDPILVPEAS